jgi:hypothetical protein
MAVGKLCVKMSLEKYVKLANAGKRANGTCDNATIATLRQWKKLANFV